MLSEQDLNVFFGVPIGYSFSDPRVVYDPIAARWFASGLAFNASLTSEAYLAVSAGTDPSGSWTIYQTATSPDLFDQPKIGVTTDKLVMSWNEYSGATLAGQETQVIQKSDLLAGRAPSGFAFSLDRTRFNLVPVPIGSSSTAYLVYNRNVLRGTPYGGAYIGVVAITGTPAAANVVWSESDLAIIPTSAPPNARQPAGAPTLDTGGTGGDRFLSVAKASDVVSIMGNDGCVPNGDSAVRSCLRLIQVSVSATPTVLRDLDWAATGADLFYPAAVSDSTGNLYAVLSGSSSGLYASVFGAFQPSGTSGGFNLMQLQSGVGVYNSSVCGGMNRWGDYSGAALDPSDPTDVWVAGEYVPATSACGWGTAIARLTLGVPAIKTVTPPSGPAIGGTTVTLAGADFVPGATAVYFGQTASPTVTVQSPNQLTAVTPAESGGTVPVTAVTANGGSAVSPSIQFTFGAAAGSTGGQYHSLAPVRILDTRNGTGGVPAAPIGPGGALNVQVAGAEGVPSTASAAVINVTVTNTTASSYLTVYPAGVTRPLASNLNWVAGKTVPNLVEIPLGTGGQATIYNAAGNADVLFDVAGYVSSAAPPGPDGLYNPLVPARILDTRNGTGAPLGPLGAGRVLNLQMTGQGGGLPPSGISAVVLNVTVTNPTAPSYLTVFPTGTGPPLASNLNFVAGQTVPNRVIVAVGTGGQVSFFNAQGSVDVVADVGGWFTDSSNPSATGSTFIGVTPARILDTRDGTGLANGVNGVGPIPITPLGPGQGSAVQVAGQGGIPAMTDPSPPNAVVANVTVTNPTASGYLTAWPDGSSRPLASDLNWVAGLTVPNLVIVKLGSSGMADLYNAAGCTDAIVDVVGYYTGPLPPASSPIAPTPSCRVNGNPWGYNFTCCNFITAPTANFCAYFSCIANLPNGNGYVIECLDTMYSKSGGIQGACSFHSGVWRPLYTP